MIKTRSFFIGVYLGLFVNAIISGGLVDAFRDSLVLTIVSISLIFCSIYLYSYIEEEFSRYTLIERFLIMMAIFFIQDNRILYSILFASASLIMIVVVTFRVINSVTDNPKLK